MKINGLRLTGAIALPFAHAWPAASRQATNARSRRVQSIATTAVGVNRASAQRHVADQAVNGVDWRRPERHVRRERRTGVQWHRVAQEDAAMAEVTMDA